jgi:hypothetical protein
MRERLMEHFGSRWNAILTACPPELAEAIGYMARV